MITFQRFARGQVDLVAHLQILPEQKSFSAAPHDQMGDPNPDVHFYAILSEAEVVGMFKIDPASAMDFARPGEIGLRGMLIGAQYQGRGLGKASFAALPDMLRQAYPQAPGAVLSVNFRNPGAHHVYEATGWVTDPAPYLGGPAGPQHVMRLAL